LFFLQHGCVKSNKTNKAQVHPPWNIWQKIWNNFPQGRILSGYGLEELFIRADSLGWQHNYDKSHKFQ
jgi:hypothetical protein